MKYCINCGAETEDYMKYCPVCGANQAGPQGVPPGGGEEARLPTAASVPERPKEGLGQDGAAFPPGAPVPPAGANGGPQRTPVGGSLQDRPKPRSNGLAIAGFVVSLCLVLFVEIPAMGLALALVSLGLSISGMIIANRNNGAIGMAVAGLVLSIVLGLASVYYLLRFSLSVLF
ncbi:MAG: zinc ribbon domain-containing protein [Oscillospiraceae bacterium]|jgi:hypothetical protein